MTRARFHSLDAFRFIAFLKVFLLHIPIASGAFPLFEKLKAGGEVGVLFFFVLSGFLITYLLLLEKTETGGIGLGNFFIRRALRIWPVFFLTVGLVYLIPDAWLARAGFLTIKGYEPEWQYSFTFLENYKMTLERLPPRVGTLWVNWSVCIEQHFYIVWPFLVWLIPAGRLPVAMLLIILAANIFRYLSLVWWPGSMGYVLRYNDILTNMDFLALGGLAAWLVVFQGKVLGDALQQIPMPIKWIFILLVLMSLFLSGLLPNSDDARLFTYPLYGLLFTALLLLVSSADSPLRIKDSSWISYFGRISYGLYMYHLFVILVVVRVLKVNGLVPDTIVELLVYILFTLAVCIILSSASWKYFELPFLKMKRKLSS